MSARRTFSVIRMKIRRGQKSAPGRLPPLFKTKADVIEPNAVGIKTFATRSEYSNNLRNEVDYLTELRFLLADLCLGALLVAQVEDEGDALVRILKQRASQKHRQAAAIFPEKLLLVCWKKPVARASVTACWARSRNLAGVASSQRNRPETRSFSPI